MTAPDRATTASAATDAGRTVELAIGGMTCAACAARVERRLNRLPGVIASVNLATEQAQVTYADPVTPAELVATVQATGYTAVLPAPTAAPRSSPTSSGDPRNDGVAPAAPDLRGSPGDDGESGDPRKVTAAQGTASFRGSPGAGDPEARDPLRRRLVVSAVLTVPVLLLGMVPALQSERSMWLAFLLATPVAVWGAWPFHRAAWLNLRHGAATMDTLVSLGVTAAYLWSVVALLTGGESYLEVAAAVTTFLLAGRSAESRARRRSGDALRTLLSLGAKDVAVLRGGAEGRVPVEDLAVGDLFLVRPGELVATDGTVTEGTSAVDASLVTGEAVPVEVGPGDPVVGATVNAGGRLVVRATRVGADTQLAQMARLVAAAQHGKAPVQRLADRISAVFVPVVLGLALATLVGWLVLDGSWEQAGSAAVAVLIIACPCALGLATPTALLVGTGRGAQLGVIIKGPEVPEQTRAVDTVVLDKTGTVTTGRMQLVGVAVASGEAEADILRLAGAVEDASEHPVARAVAAGARERLGTRPPSTPAPPAVAAFASTQGLGVVGRVDGRLVVAGRPGWLTGAHELDLPVTLRAAVDRAEAGGRTAVAVGWDGLVRAVFEVADTVKPTSARAVRELRALGLDPVLLTGDGAAAARRVADEVGISRVEAEVLPADKVSTVARLQSEGRVVAMVGDGVNDAAALAQADLGLALGTGADVAIEASDLTLVRGDLLGAVDAIRLSRRTLRTIKGNLFWAFGYNVAAIPLAMAGLLSPVVAGAAMACSSLFVVGNSLRLRRFRSVGWSSTRTASARAVAAP